MPDCRACPAEIFFAVQNRTDGKAANNNPLDRRPNPEKGNLRVDFSTSPPKYDVLSKEDATAARERGEELYISHFVTCPNRGQFRKGGKK
jgi:hypothetical protein